MTQERFNKDVYFLRHGQTDYNKKGIVQGRGVNSDLNAQGMKQAKAFFEMYEKEGFDLIVSSSLKRTSQSVNPFILSGLDYVQKPEIDEMDWGIHEGKNPDPGMKEGFESMLEMWRSGDFSARLEGGESLIDLAHRLSDFISFLEKSPYSKILVASHGRTLMCLMCLLDGQSLSKMDSYGQPNMGLNKARFEDGKWSVDFIGNTTHLKAKQDV